MTATVEDMVSGIRSRHELSGIHLFQDDDGWRAFGFRKNAKGFQASAERGAGPTIAGALQNLDTRLIEGPIHK